jgi:hypothetical protein
LERRLLLHVACLLGPTSERKERAGIVTLSLGEYAVTGFFQVHGCSTLFDLFDNVRFKAELPAFLPSERVRMPAGADQAVERLGRFFAGLCRPEDSEGEISGVKPAVFVAREAFKEQG